MIWRHSLALSSPHAVQSSCDSSLCRHVVGSMPQLLRGAVVPQWCKRRVQIVSRRRGFTVETCTAVVPAAKESPTFQGLSAGQRVTVFIMCLSIQCSHTPSQAVHVSRWPFPARAWVLHYGWPAGTGECSGDAHVPGLTGRRAAAGLRGLMPGRLPRRPGRVHRREQRPERVQGAVQHLKRPLQTSANPMLVIAMVPVQTAAWPDTLLGQLPSAGTLRS